MNNNEKPAIDYAVTQELYEEACIIAAKLIELTLNPSEENLKYEFEVHHRIEYIGKELVSTILADMTADETDSKKRLAASIRLLRMGSSLRYASEAIVKIFDSGDVYETLLILDYLNSIASIPANIIASVKLLLKSKNFVLQITAANIVRPGNKVIRILNDSLSDDEPEIAARAARALVRHDLHTQAATDVLLGLLGSDKPNLVVLSILSLSNDRRYKHIIYKAFITLLRDDTTSQFLRAQIISALGKMNFGEIARDEFSLNFQNCPAISLIESTG